MKKRKALIFKTKNIKPKVEKDIKPFIDLIIKQSFVEGGYIFRRIREKKFFR